MPFILIGPKCLFRSKFKFQLQRIVEVRHISITISVGAGHCIFVVVPLEVLAGGLGDFDGE